MTLPQTIVADLTTHPGPWPMRDLRVRYSRIGARYLRATLARMIADGRVIRQMRYGQFVYGVRHD